MAQTIPFEVPLDDTDGVAPGSQNLLESKKQVLS
jgi:hypothetical protein